MQWIQYINTDKVWLCKFVGKLKGVGQLVIARTNELIIHTISDLQLLVHHRGKVFLALALALDLALDMAQALDLALALEMGREVKVIILHVEILLYH